MTTKVNAGMTNDKFAAAVNHGLRSKRVCTALAVYKRPMDYPTEYVARAFFNSPGRVLPSKEIFIVKDTL